MTTTAADLTGQYITAALLRELPTFSASITSEYYREGMTVHCGINRIEIDGEGRATFTPANYSGHNLTVAADTAHAARVIAEILRHI